MLALIFELEISQVARNLAEVFYGGDTEMNWSGDYRVIENCGVLL